MRVLLVAAVALAGCTYAAPAPLDPVARGAALDGLDVAVRVAARECTVNAQALQSDALFDTCVRALIPARDAVHFVAPNVDASIGCAGKAVRVALERVRDAFDARGLSTTSLRRGIYLGSSVERYALPTCDPLHPTTSTTLYVDPNIAPVEPNYP